MILFNDVASQWKEIEETTLPKLTEFLRTGPYILGAQVEAFEKEFAAYCGSKYAVGVSNGTDGLKLAIQCLMNLGAKKIRRIIVPANGYIADALAPLYCQLPIEFVDCDQYYNIDTRALKEKLSHDTGSLTIVLAVHLYGQAANIPEIRKISPDVLIIEDCSQAHGTTINGQKVGTLGDIGVFSLYPTKNLGAFGDAGIIITNQGPCRDFLVSLRNYGSVDKIHYPHIGHNARLDDLQALILRDKLPLLDKWIKIKQDLAVLYDSLLCDINNLEIYKKAPYNDGSTYHIYPIRIKKRDQLKNYLARKNIPTLIHYPMPLHKTEVLYDTKSYKNSEQFCQEILSLPMHPYLTAKDINFITNSIKDFFKEQE